MNYTLQTPKKFSYPGFPLKAATENKLKQQIRNVLVHISKLIVAEVILFKVIVPEFQNQIAAALSVLGPLEWHPRVGVGIEAVGKSDKVALVCSSGRCQAVQEEQVQNVIGMERAEHGQTVLSARKV